MGYFCAQRRWILWAQLICVVPWEVITSEKLFSEVQETLRYILWIWSTSNTKKMELIFFLSGQQTCMACLHCIEKNILVMNFECSALNHTMLTASKSLLLSEPSSSFVCWFHYIFYPLPARYPSDLQILFYSWMAWFYDLHIVHEWFLGIIHHFNTPPPFLIFAAQHSRWQYCPL